MYPLTDASSKSSVERNLEQPYAVKFCWRLGKTATETKQMLGQAYKEDAMSRSSVFEWHKLFREGRELVEDDHRTGRPSSSRTDDTGQSEVTFGLRSTLVIHLICDELNLSYGTVHRIITDDLSMKKVCAKMVPKILRDEQQAKRVEISQEILNCLEEDEHFLADVITGDETWVFEYDPETKRQSEEGHTSS